MRPTRAHPETRMTLDRHIVLIGLPGAGKTSIGRHLAKLLQRPFADADEQLELTAGCTIPRLVRERGDDELQRQERKILTDLLRRYGTLVISAPGAVEIEDEMQALLARSAVVLWIRGPIPLLTELSDPLHRPRLADGHHESLARLERELSAVYEDVADHIVDIEPFHTLDDEPKRTISRHILELLDVTDLPPDTTSPAHDDLSALYEEVADHIVDIEPFHTLDDEPKHTITRHILHLLAQHGIHPR